MHHLDSRSRLKTFFFGSLWYHPQHSVNHVSLGRLKMPDMKLQDMTHHWSTIHTVVQKQAAIKLYLWAYVIFNRWLPMRFFLVKLDCQRSDMIYDIIILSYETSISILSHTCRVWKCLTLAPRWEPVSRKCRVRKF